MVLEERKCLECGKAFRVLPTSPHKYHSEFCAERHGGADWEKRKSQKRRLWGSGVEIGSSEGRRLEKFVPEEED